mgnify:CR=1 FL=1
MRGRSALTGESAERDGGRLTSRDHSTALVSRGGPCWTAVQADAQLVHSLWVRVRDAELRAQATPAANEACDAAQSRS